MNIQLDELRQFMDDVASRRGEFTAFGFFLREDAPGVWDLVVAAPWLKGGRLEQLRELGADLSAAFEAEQMLSISRIVVLKEGDPALEVMLRMGDPDGTVEFTDSDEYGPRIRRGFILKASRSGPESMNAA